MKKTAATSSSHWQFYSSRTPNHRIYVFHNNFSENFLLLMMKSMRLVSRT